MARPHKIDDYHVHRIADLFLRYADGLPFSESSKGYWWDIMLADKRVRITGKQAIWLAVGAHLCTLEPQVRSRFLRQIADALQGKLEKKRKSGKADDIAKIRAAWLEAKAGLKRNPTFTEVDGKYSNKNGSHLDRRAVKNAGCPVRNERGEKKLPRLDVTRNRGKGVRP